MAGWTGLEPAAFCVTGRRSNQLSYHPNKGKRRKLETAQAKSRAVLILEEDRRLFVENSVITMSYNRRIACEVICLQNAGDQLSVVVAQLDRASVF